MNADAIYIPDNPRLLAVLDGLPNTLRRYRDYAALLIHFANVRRWMRWRNDGEENFARLNSLILRKYIPQRQITPLREHLVKCGVLVLDGYSTGRYSIGHRIADDFDGLPFRWQLSEEKLIQKRRAWRETVICKNTPEMRELAERRKPVTDSMRGTLDRLGLCASAAEVEGTLQGRGIDPAHLRYCCSIIENHDHEGLYMDSFGWRVHSIMTHTTSELRPYLRFDCEPLIELDVRNAQPLILAVALRNPTICTTYIGNAQHIGSKEAGPLLLGFLRSIPEREINEFSRLCESGHFYETLMAGSNGESREKVKLSVYRDVFSANTISAGRLLPCLSVFFRASSRCCERSSGHSATKQ